MNIDLIAKVNNCPTYAKDYKYVIATVVSNELWFWGATNDYDKALEIIHESEYRVILTNN